MTAEMCRHQRQLVHCAECAPEAERRHAALKAHGDEMDIRKSTVGGDMKFRFGLIKRSNDDPIPEDKPIFILRARDNLAVPTLQHYRRMSDADGCTAYHMEGLNVAIAAFVRWGNENQSKMKQPGVTRGR